MIMDGDGGAVADGDAGGVGDVADGYGFWLRRPFFRFLVLSLARHGGIVAQIGDEEVRLLVGVS